MGGVQSAIAASGARDNLPPLHLRRAIDAATAGVGFRDLRAAAQRLSAGYRAGGEPPERGAAAWTDLDCLAYAAARMPATWRATGAVLAELRARCPALPLRSLLDIGSGPGTALWAAWTELDGLTRATLLEPDSRMAALARRFVQESPLAARIAATWWEASAAHLAAAEPHDLVVAGYVLAELDADGRRQAVEAAWEASAAALAVIEPGSDAGYHRILDAREQLIARGARIVAPCPHAAACPLPPGDWCHFGARLNRTSLQRRLKDGTQGYEDEKYAYVVAVRGAGSPAEARVIRRPRPARGRVTLRLCRRDGVGDETVARSRGAAYRLARKAAWGDAWRHAGAAAGERSS